MTLLFISIPLMLLGIAIATAPLVAAMRRQHHDIESHLEVGTTRPVAKASIPVAA